MEVTGDEVELTVILVEQAAADLEAVQRRSGLSVTDIVNRALSLYEFADRQLAAGKDMLVRDPATGEMRAVRLL